MSLIRDDDDPWRVLGVLFAFIVAGVLVLPSPVRIVVERGTVQMAPAWVRLRVQVEPHAANRTLTVGIDSGGYLREMDEQLEGTRARRTRTVEFPDVPAGEYVAYATVDRGAERPWRTWTRFIVVGPP